METKELTCIGCPLGCNLHVTIDEKNITVSGNNCPNGEKYAKNEISNPTRIVTSTIKVINGDIERASCKTKSPIPKDKIFDCMKEIKMSSAVAPIEIGDVLIKNVANTGIDVVATKQIKKVSN